MSLNAKLRLIDSNPKLIECIAVISGSSSGVIGLDTEAAWWRMGKQHEKLSTIQIAVEIAGVTQAFVIDALSNAHLELSLLQTILSSNKYLKIIHNASYDVRKLQEHAGIKVTPVWCTLSAERRAGSKKNNKLDDLAKRYFNQIIDKDEQQAEWGFRPLSKKQLVYAATDAVIALRIYHEQAKNGLDGRYGEGASLPLLDQVINETAIMPGMEETQDLSKRLNWLRTFISSGNAKEFPAGFYTPSLIWVDDVEAYAIQLEKWISEIVGERTLTLEEQHEQDSYSECIPYPSANDGIQVLNNFYAYIQEGKRWPQAEALTEKCKRERIETIRLMKIYQLRDIYQRFFHILFEKRKDIWENARDLKPGYQQIPTKHKFKIVVDERALQATV
jgi:ribonuclease D